VVYCPAFTKVTENGHGRKCSYLPVSLIELARLLFGGENVPF
jgi:hypothetical protein